MVRTKYYRAFKKKRERTTEIEGVDFLGSRQWMSIVSAVFGFVPLHQISLFVSIAFSNVNISVPGIAHNPVYVPGFVFVAFSPNVGAT